MFYCFIILCKQILFKVHSLWGELWMFFMVWWKVSSGCTSVKVIVKGPLQQALAHILDRKCAMLRLMTLFFKESCVGVQKLHFDFSINHSFALWVGLTLNRILQPWGHNICLTLTIHIGYCTISTGLSWYIPFLYFLFFLHVPLIDLLLQNTFWTGSGKLKGMVHPKNETHLQAIQDVDKFVSSSEEIWGNSVLHHLLTNGSSAVNGCRQ